MGKLHTPQGRSTRLTMLTVLCVSQWVAGPLSEYSAISLQHSHFRFGLRIIPGCLWSQHISGLFPGRPNVALR